MHPRICVAEHFTVHRRCGCDCSWHVYGWLSAGVKSGWSVVAQRACCRFSFPLLGRFVAVRSFVENSLGAEAVDASWGLLWSCCDRICPDFHIDNISPLLDEFVTAYACEFHFPPDSVHCFLYSALRVLLARSARFTSSMDYFLHRFMTPALESVGPGP